MKPHTDPHSSTCDRGTTAELNQTVDWENQDALCETLTGVLGQLVMETRATGMMWPPHMDKAAGEKAGLHTAPASHTGRNCHPSQRTKFCSHFSVLSVLASTQAGLGCSQIFLPQFWIISSVMLLPDIPACKAVKMRSDPLQESSAWAVIICILLTKGSLIYRSTDGTF